MRTNRIRTATHACARLLAAVLAVLCCLPAAGALAESDGMVRVKLARLGSPASIAMRADCDYFLSSDATVRVSAGVDMTVAASGGSLTLTAGERVVALGASARLVRDADGRRGVQFLSPALSNRFCGDLLLSASGNVVNTVLEIYVEDYLYGVVGYEMAPSSGLEALKAQAVVARNYALRQKAARSGAAYDLSDAGDALSFRGYSAAAEYADAVKAVDATKGQALYYGGSLATCYFCDSNGGQMESAANALGASLPYADAVQDDPFDYEGAGVKKTATLRKDGAGLHSELVDALVSGAEGQLKSAGIDPAAVRVAAIEDVLTDSPRFAAPSRLYRALVFRVSFTDGARTTPAVVSVPTYGGLEKWYDLSINAKDNETVWVSETGSAFEITFRRSGEGVGLSQRGAQVMAREGLSCADILDYYYPGTEIRELALANTGRGAAVVPSIEAIAVARLGQKARLYDAADDAGGSSATLPAGATVDVYAVQGEWAAVGSGGLYGFVHADALASFALRGVTAVQVKDETLARLGSNPSDVLQLPVATAKVLTHLLGGETVRLNAYTDAWALVTTADGVEGFIPRDALTPQAGNGAGGDGDIVTAPSNLYALLTEDAGLYVNADDSVSPRLTLNRGGYVQILAYNQSWAYVRVDGESGFVKLSALSVVQSQPKPGATVDGGAITLVEGTEYRYVGDAALPLYERYDTSSRVLATLEPGARVRLGAYNEKWACVRADGVTGFALLSGLTEEAPAPSAIEGGAVTTVRGEAYATVVHGGAGLYAAWSDADAPLMTLKQGEKVRLGAYNGLWACVRVDGVTGYMRVEDLELSAAEDEADDGVSYTECDAVTTAGTALYGKSSLEGAALAQLPQGTTVHVYAYNRTAAYVDYEGRKGFVALRLLKKSD